MKSRVAPEYAFLLACTGRGRSAPLAPDLLPQGPVAWRRVEDVAAWHRLAALVFTVLRRLEFASRAPQDTLLRLERTYYENVARGLYLQAELHKILQVFHAAGVPAVALKGAALVSTVYPDPALRPMHDLDLLVPEQHLDRADTLVRSLGYASGAFPDDERRQREAGHHYPSLYSADGVVAVELHRHLVDLDSPLHFDITEMWARARPATVAGVQALAPAPEDLLLHLCLHFFLNRRSSSRGALGQIWDIAETVQHYGDTLDWNRFIDAARRQHLTEPLALALGAAHALLAAPVAGVVRALQPAAFPPDLIDHFLTQRVLSTRSSWPSLAGPEESYTRLTAARTLGRLVFPGRSRLAGPDASTPGLVARRYLRHLLIGTLRYLRWAVCQPRRTWADLRLDRAYQAATFLRGALSGAPGTPPPERERSP